MVDEYETVEVIPIPKERARNRDPIHIRLNSLDSWPTGGTFQIRMDWNSAIQRWVFEMERDGFGLLFPRTVAHIDRPMIHGQYLMVMFGDRSGESTQVLPRNLGSNVKLIAVPGPDSEAYPTEVSSPDPPWVTTRDRGRYA